MARMSLDEIRSRASTVDQAKIDATTEAQIEAHRAADGDADLAVPEAVQVVEAPRALRVRLGFTQREMADALRVPLGTWRNWEQGRGAIEPAVASLLAIVARAPNIAFSALNWSDAEWTTFKVEGQPFASLDAKGFNCFWSGRPLPILTNERANELLRLRSEGQSSATVSAAFQVKEPSRHG